MNFNGCIGRTYLNYIISIATYSNRHTKSKSKKNTEIQTAILSKIKVEPI